MDTIIIIIEAHQPNELLFMSNANDVIKKSVNRQRKIDNRQRGIDNRQRMIDICMVALARDMTNSDQKVLTEHRSANSFSVKIQRKHSRADIEYIIMVSSIGSLVIRGGRWPGLFQAMQRPEGLSEPEGNMIVGWEECDRSMQRIADAAEEAGWTVDDWRDETGTRRRRIQRTLK